MNPSAQDWIKKFLSTYKQEVISLQFTSDKFTNESANAKLNFKKIKKNSNGRNLVIIYFIKKYFPFTNIICL